MQMLARERQSGNHRLSTACSVTDAEIDVFDSGGPLDRAEAVAELARVIADMARRR
jgi:hypothetical protein